MRQGVLDEWHADQVLLGSLDAFLDRQRHFARLAGAETDVSGLVTHDDQRRERKIFAALDDLGHTIDRNDLIFQIESLSQYSLLRLSHYSSLASLASLPSLAFASTALSPLLLLPLAVFALALFSLALAA